MTAPPPLRSALAVLLLGALPALALAAAPHPLDAVDVAAGDEGDADTLSASSTVSRLGLSDRETPATVSVIDRHAIDSLGLRTLIELYRSAPGVSAGNIPGSPASISMRGLTDVGYLFDGERAVDPSLVSRNLDTWNLQRVEILKGPSSVVHGSGALAGTVNLVTRQPDLAGNRYDTMIGYGSHDSLRLGAGTNRVIGPNTAVRLDVSHSESNGYVDDTGSRVDALTLSTLIRASDRLTLTLAADLYQDSYNTPYQGTPLLPANVAHHATGVVDANDGLVLDKSIRDNNYNVDDGEMSAQSQWLRASADYQLNDRWRLVSETGLYNANRDWANSEDFTYNDGTGLLDRSTTRIHHHHRFASQRLYAAYDGRLAGHRHRFSGGVSYQYTDFDTRRRFGSTDSVDPFHPERGVLPANNAAHFDTRVNYDSQVSGQAAFVEDAFNLTPGWLLIAGARYEYQDLDRGVDDLDAGTRQQVGHRFEDLSWRLGTVYDLTNRTQLYAQFNRAASPIGSLLLSSLSNAEFDLTRGKAWEGGIRGHLWDEHLTVTASVYQIRQDEILTRDPANPALTVQGGSLRSRGVELDATLTPSDRWWINVNAAFADPRYTRLDGAGGTDLSGNRPANVPRKTANLSAAHRFAALPLTLGAAARYTGNFYTSTDNRYRVDGRTLLDAWLSWPFARGTMTLRGRNLTDRFYVDWSGYSATQVYVGEPRSVALSWSGHF